jgi:hypothetical protein
MDRFSSWLAAWGYTLFLTPGEAVLSLHAPHVKRERPSGLATRNAPRPSRSQLTTTAAASTVRLQLIGANTKAEVAGIDPLPGE